MPIHDQLFDLLFVIRARMRELAQEPHSLLSPMQILVLRILVKSGPIPQTELVKLTGRDKSQIARLVRDLEKKGLLSRTRSPEDMRNYVLRPAKDVEDTVSTFLEHERALVDQMLEGVSPKEAAQLEKLLSIMRHNLER